MLSIFNKLPEEKYARKVAINQRILYSFLGASIIFMIFALLPRHDENYVYRDEKPENYNDRMPKAQAQDKISESYDKEPKKQQSYSYTPSHPPAYEMMTVAFEGNPPISQIKPLMEAIMKKYDIPIDEDHLMKVSSVAVSLRKKSAVGVTEMDLLKHIYQNGNPLYTFAEQAAHSMVYLEYNK